VRDRSTGLGIGDRSRRLGSFPLFFRADTAILRSSPLDPKTAAAEDTSGAIDCSCGGDQTAQ
jgi:hypothetical protein